MPNIGALQSPPSFSPKGWIRSMWMLMTCNFGQEALSRVIDHTQMCGSKVGRGRERPRGGTVVGQQPEAHGATWNKLHLCTAHELLQRSTYRDWQGGCMSSCTRCLTTHASNRNKATLADIRRENREQTMRLKNVLIDVLWDIVGVKAVVSAPNPTSSDVLCPEGQKTTPRLQASTGHPARYLQAYPIPQYLFRLLLLSCLHASGMGVSIPCPTEEVLKSFLTFDRPSSLATVTALTFRVLLLCKELYGALVYCCLQSLFMVPDQLQLKHVCFPCDLCFWVSLWKPLEQFRNAPSSLDLATIYYVIKTHDQKKLYMSYLFIGLHVNTHTHSSYQIIYSSDPNNYFVQPSPWACVAVPHWNTPSIFSSSGPLRDFMTQIYYILKAFKGPTNDNFHTHPRLILATTDLLARHC